MSHGSRRYLSGTVASGNVFTIATVVAPSAMKSEEGEAEAEAPGEVPTVGDEAAEGEAGEGDNA